MADSISDQIKEGKSLIEKLQREIAKMESADGDDDEGHRIKQTKAQIAQLKADLDRLQKQLDADRTEWKGLSDDLSEARARLSTLKDWGTFDVAALDSEISAAEDLAAAESYREAITRLGEVSSGLVKPYAEYTKQFEAKRQYDSAIDDVDTRLAKAKASKFQTDAVGKGVAQVMHNLPEVRGRANAKDYVAAVKLLESTSSELALVETEVAKAGEEDEVARREYGPLVTASSDAEAIAFEDLKERVATARADTENVRRLIDAFDFLSARSQIATLLHEFELIHDEAEKLEAAKKAEAERQHQLQEEWKRNARRWAEIQKKVGELENWGSKEAANLRALVSEVEGYVASEEYQFAIDALPSVESALGAPYADYLKQQEAQTSYDQARPPLDTRAQAARGHQFADGDVGTMLDTLDSDLGWMDGMARDKDYVQAGTRLSGAGAQLDRIERALRELETLAEVAEEMGDVSSPEAEKEVKRRLYAQEHPIARKRIDAAAQADVLGGDDAVQLEQLESALLAAESSAQAENYVEALDGVRTLIDEMPTVEQAIRLQAEKKSLYDDALATVKAEIATFGSSAYRIVREDAATLENSLAEGESLAQAHDHAAACAKADAWITETDRIRKAESEVAKDQASADAALTAIQSRLDKALANESAEVQPGLEGLRSQKAAVDRDYENEDYAAAATSLGKLEELLVEFEQEAEKQDQKDLYDAAVKSLRLESRMAEAVSGAYPEAEEAYTAADTCDRERKSLAGEEKYEAARGMAFDQGKALDGFDTRKGEIGVAKEQYENNLPTLQEALDEALAPLEPDQSSDEVVQAQADLNDLQQQLDLAVAQSRYIEAMRLSDEAKTKADEVNKLRFDLTPIDEAATVEFITGCVKMAAFVFGSGANDAVLKFNDIVIDSVTSERDGQTYSKWIGYAMDVAAAVAAFSQKHGPKVGAFTTGVKTVVTIGAAYLDSADDDAERALAQQLIAQLEQQASEVESSFNGDFGGYMQANVKDTFDKVGRFLARKEMSQARSALKAYGVPMDATVTGTMKHFLGPLKAKFEASKR